MMEALWEVVLDQAFWIAGGLLHLPVLWFFYKLGSDAKDRPNPYDRTR